MAIESYIEDILHSPVYVFDEIVEKIIDKNAYFAEIELKRCPLKVDSILFESIKSILKDLKEEEGVFSCFLYATFGVEIRKNKRREQLIYLGSELKTQHIRIQKNLRSIRRQQERLSYSINDLERLKDAFLTKNMFFENDKVKNKSKFFMSKIESKMSTLEEYQVSLLMKYNDLVEVEKLYRQLFIQIPRYHELQEETHRLLLPHTLPLQT